MRRVDAFLEEEVLPNTIHDGTIRTIIFSTLLLKTQLVLNGLDLLFMTTAMLHDFQLASQINFTNSTSNKQQAIIAIILISSLFVLTQMQVLYACHR